MTLRKVDICVIGGGSGGLSVAAGAVQMGASVALFERGAMGGDCLNHGCVPSKALLAAAKAAAGVAGAGAFGVDAELTAIDRRRVAAHVRGVIAASAPHDSVDRFTRWGGEVITAAGRFVDARTVTGGGFTVRARRIVIATGSRPMEPPIAGLDRVGYLTNETIFDLEEMPRHLIILGGGPIGIEMAQAHRRLGAAVTVVEMARIMVKDDPVLVDMLRGRLVAEGIDLREGAAVTAVAREGAEVIVTVTDDAGETHRLRGSHLLVAAGRRPNLENLDLARAGIAAGRGGITVDRGLKTSNRRVYAIGDVAGPYQFTHLAGYHASVVLRSALFRLPARVNYDALPWATYTEPELAQVGLGEAAARARYGRVEVLEGAFDANDRAVAEHKTLGMVRAMVRPNGRVVGAAILGPGAGDLIHPWTLAIARRLPIGALATTIAAYPTFGDLTRSTAGKFYTPKLFNSRTRRLVRWLAKLG